MSSTDSTLAFYEEGALEYFQRTADVDMSAERAAFLEAMRSAFPGVDRFSVLDAGCGSGRDAKAFAEAGLSVTAFDASRALVEIATRHTGLPVQHRRFDELVEREAYHGVWACASLLHLSAEEFEATLVRMRVALIPGGVLYLSVKEGDGSRVEPDGRFFTYYRRERLHHLLTKAGFDVLTLEVSHSRLGQPVQWLGALSRAVP